VKVLVAYASRHGATAGIAERIAERLGTKSIDAVAADVEDVSRLKEYDAVVLGSAAYMFHWLKSARRFAAKNRSELASKPLWLFSSGPTGTDLVDDKGRDVFESSRPKEFEELGESLSPRGMKVFFGAYDPEAEAIGMAEKFMNLMPQAKAEIPSGDFRDWEAIDAWADEISAALLDD